MTQATEDLAQDALQVCRNGHVVTDRARGLPETRRTHCDRCGAATVDRCATCGGELPGAVPVPGLVPVGTPRPPQCCSGCGAAFPWAEAPKPAAGSPLVTLDTLLRRLPRVARQLRWRQGDRPPFRVEDERDLEDLLRALLPLYFDNVRPESRTPRYAAGTRTDFLLPTERVAVAVKLARPALRGPQLAEQLREDADHYRGRADCATLVAFVYDPEGLLHEPRTLEAAWSAGEDGRDLRCVIAGAS